MSKKIGFMFAGQGAQFPAMGLDLYHHSAAAREVFDTADRCLGKPVSKLCFAGTTAELTDTANCQPAIYTVSIACLAVLQEKIGRRQPPDCGAGLSLGEFAALHAAAAMSFTDGLKLLAHRGRCMAEACARTQGTMAAVLNADPEMVEAVCRRCDIDVANYNCPGQLVVSGERQRLQQAVAELQAQGVKRVVPLSVAGAFHSRLMDEAARAFSPFIEATVVHRPVSPVVQNVTGQPGLEPAEIKSNLERQVNGSVRWESCVRHMMDQVDLLIELGPGSVLTGFVKRIDRAFPVLPAGTLAQIEEAAAACRNG